MIAMHIYHKYIPKLVPYFLLGYVEKVGVEHIDACEFT